METAPKNNVAEGKARMSLIPMDVLERYLVPAYEEGLIKYSRESWRQGFLISDMIDALRRHETDFYHKGEDIDPGALKLGVKKHHIGGMLFCLLAMAHTIDTRPELDDRPGKSRLMRCIECNLPKLADRTDCPRCGVSYEIVIDESTMIAPAFIDSNDIKVRQDR